MSSHELAQKLLALPDYEVCILKTEKKYQILPTTDVHIFKGATAQPSNRIVIASEGQQISSPVYWLGDVVFTPEDHIDSSSFRVRGQ